MAYDLRPDPEPDPDPDLASILSVPRPMPTVVLTPHLRRFFDLPDRIEAQGKTVAQVLAALDERWPGLAFYVTDEQGRLRQHVAIWVDGRRVEDRDALADTVEPDGHVTILQALSGG